MNECIREYVSDGRGTRRCQGQGGGNTPCFRCQQGARIVRLSTFCATRGLTHTWQLWRHLGTDQECRILPHTLPQTCMLKSEKGHSALLPFLTPPKFIKTPSGNHQGQCRQLLGRERLTGLLESDPPLFRMVSAPPSWLNPLLGHTPPLAQPPIFPLRSWETRLKLFKRNLY